jgi:hypothetical protein
VPPRFVTINGKTYEATPPPIFGERELNKQRADTAKRTHKKIQWETKPFKAKGIQ